MTMDMETAVAGQVPRTRRATFLARWLIACDDYCRARRHREQVRSLPDYLLADVGLDRDSLG